MLSPPILHNFISVENRSITISTKKDRRRNFLTIREYTERTGEYLSIRKLAGHTGIAPSSICTVISGKTTRADFRTMERLLEFFGETLEKPLTVSDLLEYEPEQPIN